MNRELYVSSTPHETKVGMVEDDQLAEIYLERENEYTLAGSIYKGRVTRVLPGMQSAFVDIGLERDAFLYVSDFMELEDSEDLDDVPTTGRPAQEPRQQQSRPVAESQPFAAEGAEEAEADGGGDAEPQGEGEAQSRSDNGRDGRGGFRGRRRRRGRRGERMPESKFARPTDEAPVEVAPPVAERPARFERPVRAERVERSEDSDYGPPPGYQPIVLPGESISKYSRMSPARPAAPAQIHSDVHRAVAEAPATPLAATFPEDEPMFADGHEPSDGQAAFGLVEKPVAEEENYSAWDREQKRLHEMNVAAVFGGDAAEEEPAQEEVHHEPVEVVSAAAGTMEEEEIEEEEADISSYVDELEEDAAFEEMEEEAHTADEFHHPHVTEIAASGEPPVETTTAFSADPIAVETAAVGEAEEVDAEAEEEAELEEAQAEAEALVAAEGIEGGTVDAQVEVRAPASTAAYTQRTQRQGSDRGRNVRGRRGNSGGGRRFGRRENQQVPLISDLLKEGQEILVQIAKEPIGKKGARITSHIALPGRFLVYMPTVNHTGVSRKISSEEERQRLKRIIISERENGHGGFIVRTAAQGADEEELRADIRFLKGLWEEIRTRADNGKSPALIYHDLNVVERVLRDQVTSDFSAIWVDNEGEYERILRFANRFQPGLVRRVKLFTKETPLFEHFGLSEEINKALKSKVWLKSGGYIVINQTEALVAIDINTGKYVGKTARLEDTIVKTNVDAIKEIVRQIRLRDLGGIIIIDFIDMDERRNRQKVMQALEEALRADRAPSKVLQFNDFGLVAITRKRVKQSLERTIGTPCPYCESTGFVKSVTTVCNEIYIEMRKISKHIDRTDVMLRVNPEVAKALKTNNAKLLAEMEELSKRTVIVKSDASLHQEQFDIN
ncbi:MAG TPA: Rne/Rng family ribonuclease [Terriglobales bacterium]|jgi:ribonuclease G|nr:Rne/Rng family ribonuclease [Terriglobales bacterium]